VQYVLVSFSIGFIVFSSILLDYATHPVLLMAAGGLFIAFYNAARQLRYTEWIQLALVIAIHWLSTLYWCLFIYLAVYSTAFYRKEKAYSNVFFILSVCAYSIVRLAQSSLTNDELVNIVFEISIFFVFIYFFNHLIASEQKNELLYQEKSHLSRHDPLTGLINYEEFHKRLDAILATKPGPLALVIIDCNDLKSMNTELGFHEGNRLLVQIAEQLKLVCSEIMLISRYGGDEFAVVIRVTDNKSLDDIIAALNAELPQRIGIQLTYGGAIYPTQAKDKDELILAAEEHLYSMKRELWLKREEHMLRTEKLRVVGELASGMAHEIRNPLTTIKGFLQISKQNGYSIEPWYPLIMHEIHRMSELTAEFLSFSKPHVTNYKVQPIQETITRVIFLVESEANRLGHRIVYRSNIVKPVFILMDQDKIVQLLLNLIKNSFEAIQGEGVVSIILEKQQDHVIIEITDNGIGIPESELDRIFHPFYSTKEMGTGLGLSICHKIVQDHGGMIDVSSQPGRGTTFQIRLPLSPAPRS
jgi:diguanylate cyclase (GGDEF)-like protein